MTVVYNVQSIDRDAMRLGDTMAQSRYRLAQKKVELANQGDDLHAQIEAEEKLIESFEAIIGIIDRVAHVTDAGGNEIPAAELPASAVDKIMEGMAAEIEEMSDPNN